jgi:hypothetical protein
LRWRKQNNRRKDGAYGEIQPKSNFRKTLKNTRNPRSQTRWGTGANYTVVIDWHPNQLLPIKETEMNNVLSNTRNSNLYLIAALAIMVVVLLTIGIARPLSNTSPSTRNPASSYGSPAFYEYRRGEWAPGAVAASSIGSAAFYEYRRGEWGISIIDANPETSNSEFRQGERTASLSPDLRDFANYQHRQGEWLGK